ncbi:MAG: hypothetical protein ABSH06_29995 [Thermodesulfobacteriota bacterium]
MPRVKMTRITRIALYFLRFYLVFFNDKKLMMEYTNGLIFNAIAWVTSLIMIGFTLLLFIRML